MQMQKSKDEGLEETVKITYLTKKIAKRKDNMPIQNSINQA